MTEQVALVTRAGRGLGGVMAERWQKVAKIIALASDGRSDAVNVPAIASRIASLVDEGKLEAKGDVSNWRFSEVRRPKSGL